MGAILSGLLSTAVFVVVFAVTALPALVIVRDDNAFVTWGVLVACAVAGWAAARVAGRWLRRRI